MSQPRTETNPLAVKALCRNQPKVTRATASKSIKRGATMGNADKKGKVK